MSSSQTAAADRLWQRFGEMFGARFFESFGPKPSDSWKDAVKELRHDQVKAALVKVRNSGSPHPPSLPEFLSLAKNVRPVELQPHKPEPFDWYKGFGNHTLLKFLVKAPEVTDEQLKALVVRKNQLVEECRGTSAQGGDEVDEWRALMLDEFASTLLATGTSGRL